MKKPNQYRSNWLYTECHYLLLYAVKERNSYSLKLTKFIHGYCNQMTLLMRKPTNLTFFHCRVSPSQPNSLFSNGHFSRCSIAELRSFNQGQGSIRKRRSWGEQVCLPSGGTFSLSGMLHSHSGYDLHHPHCQIPHLLSHSALFYNLREKMLIPIFRNSKFRVSPVDNCSSHGKRSNFASNFRLFSGISKDNLDSDAESDAENYNDGEKCENEGGNVKSSADPKEVERVCKVIDELIALDRYMETVLDESGIFLSHDLVVDVLERYKHARKPAFRFFCWAGSKPGYAHDSRTYNSMMSILGKTRQFETMVSILEEMGEKGLLTMETFMISIKAFAAAKERKKAVGMFELMKKYKFNEGENTINFLLDTLGRAKLGKEAQALFEKLKGRFTPNLQTYTVLLNGWCRINNLMEAGKSWNEMIDMGFKPDIVAHNIMLEGLLKCKNRSEAIKLFMVMKAKGPQPNVRSYTILIQDFSKQKKMEDAVEYFDEMLESGCQPDAATYTCLLTGFGKQKNMNMVYDLLKEMKEKGCMPDGRTYNALIQMMTSKRLPDDAARMYKNMIQNGIEPSIHTYHMLMKSYFQTRNYEMGRAVWDEMIQKGCCPDDNSYVVFIGGLISHGKLGEACKYLEEMLEKGMKAPQLGYKKIAASFSRAGKPNILEELAQKMNFAGKFEVSNVFASLSKMMKKGVKRRK